MTRQEERHGGPLLDALTVLLPDAADRDLLRLCLAPQARPTVARDSSETAAGSPLEDIGVRARSLSPLLYWTLTKGNVEIPLAVRDRLRAAYVLEAARAREVEKTCERAFRVLGAAGVTVTPLKGIILAYAYYPEAGLRHCHDLDLLVDRREFSLAADSLVRAGFVLSTDPTLRGQVDARFADRGGFPIVLHRDLFQLPHYDLSHGALRERSSAGSLLGTPAEMLSASDMLVHVCGHASCSASRTDLRWVPDAWFAAGHLSERDWTALPELVSKAHLVLPLAVMLRFLRDEFSAPVPLDVIEVLESEAGHATRHDREAVIAGVERGARSGGLTMLWRCSSRQCRLLALRCMMLPSPTYIRWTIGPLSSPRTAAYVLARMLLYARLGLRHVVSKAWRSPRS